MLKYLLMIRNFFFSFKYLSSTGVASYSLVLFSDQNNKKHLEKSQH